MSTELHVELAPESKELCNILDKLRTIVEESNWNIFKSKSTLIPTMETQALLENAIKKLTKINLEFLTEEK